MLRRLDALARGIDRVSPSARRDRRTLSAAGRPHRTPLLQPRRTLGSLVPSGAVGLINAVNRFAQQGWGVRGFCGSHHHGRGPPILPRSRLVGEGSPQAQGAEFAAEKAHEELAQPLGRAPRPPKSDRLGGAATRWRRLRCLQAYPTLVGCDAGRRGGQATVGDSFGSLDADIDRWSTSRPFVRCWRSWPSASAPSCTFGFSGT